MKSTTTNKGQAARHKCHFKVAMILALGLTVVFESGFAQAANINDFVDFSAILQE